MILPLSSWLSSMSHLKMRDSSSGSAILLSELFPYIVVILSLEIVLQWTFSLFVLFFHFSMRANSPSILGLYCWMKYSLLSSSVIISFQLLSLSKEGTRSSDPDKIKVSEFSSSKYLGNPFSVFLDIEGVEISSPRPKGPLPLPAESYESESLGLKSQRLGVVKIGTLIVAV